MGGLCITVWITASVWLAFEMCFSMISQLGFKGEDVSSAVTFQLLPCMMVSVFLQTQQIGE